MTAYNDEFGYNKVKYLFFDVSNFTLKSTITLPFNEEQNIRFIDQPFVLNDKVFNFYSLIDSKTKIRKYELTIVDGFEIKQIEFEDFTFRDSMSKSITFYQINNKYYLHMLQRNKSTWENIIYTIDIENQKCTVIDQSIVKKESLYKETSHVFKHEDLERKFEVENISLLRWQTVTDNGDVYIVMYSHAYIDWTLYITKISNEKVEWTSMLNRMARRNGASYLSTNILDHSIVIADIENERMFDKNGNWVFDKTTVPAGVGFKPVKLIIDKENGNCKRELIKTDFSIINM